MAPKPAFVEFGGGALTGASRTGIRESPSHLEVVKSHCEITL